MIRKIAFVLGAAGAVLVLGTALRAGAHDREHGEEHERGQRRERQESRDATEHGGDPGRSGGSHHAALPGGVQPTYAKECGSCHVAFPPNLLPAASWTKIMAGLDRHFGQNAEVEPAVRAEVEGWLVARAGRSQEEGSLRLTEGAWFRRKHRKVVEAVSRPSIRTLANCAACHPGAERWDFEEDRVKIPRG